ncbi:hypothetical protein FPZ54_01720 [Sphingomonas suaedae]|uniref:Uncharacterized protein n=1 Tax=Sphingomonas suaedae TaxID=2599297 RepID=A0A518RBY2_9SPHN|nr:hypothetical protein [Sphingomonas suaedae]QDX24871.1 hypothetical protein FPZ54_01720 [Sphingomonas suaedae]
MLAKLSIARETGCVRIGDLAVLGSRHHKSAVEQAVGPLVIGSRDHGNGYEWLDLGGMTFGGEQAALSLCFSSGLLEAISWNVQLPDAPMESGWPTKEAIDSEVSFVRGVLLQEMGIELGSQPWGELWSHFDPRGFMASSGLRYHRSPNI